MSQGHDIQSGVADPIAFGADVDADLCYRVPTKVDRSHCGTLRSADAVHATQ